ncbi:MAG: S8 family peptidase [Flavobacteriales bacterium]|nr:S8 family peptidase [Flavobacteriales bacterium]
MKHILFTSAFAFASWFTLAQPENYLHNEVIVRLNPQLLNTDIINDEDITVSSIDNLLNDVGHNYLVDLPEKPFNIAELIGRKIFPHLGISDSISIGRQGQEVPVPPFWATFKIAVPDGLRVSQFCRDLEDLYPIVLYAHPNFIVKTTSATNDPEYPDQIALHPDNGQIDHIKMDSAWNIETGKPWIKVGVFDTGIDSTHEDIELLTGWNYYYTGAFQWGSCAQNDHGHRVAGIIGAKRNNELGVAGIAGGNGLDSTGASTGVSLLDFKRYVDPNGVSSIEEVAAGIIDASRWIGTYFDWSALAGTWYYIEHSPGYGIHIGNHSYAYTIQGDKNEEIPGSGSGGPGYYDGCNLCRESFLFSLHNGVINVVGRGNRPDVASFSTNHEGPYFLYPARYDDSWVVSVSSSGTDGNRLIGSYNGTDDYFGYYGGDVDLVAPGSQDIIRTTYSQQSPNSTEDYGAFNGTSAAAPHVSGVAALLLSYYNKNCYSNVNLDPADVEYILQESADWTEENNVDGNYSPASGHGRLNAYQALKMIELPKYQIVHPDTLPVGELLIEQDTINVRLASPLSTNPGGPYGDQFPLQPNTDYKVIRYKYQLEYDFSQYMQPSTTLLDTWVRHSQTNSLRKHIDTTWISNPYYSLIIDTIGVEPMCKIDSILGDTSIFLSGYFYHFINEYLLPLDFYQTPSSISSDPIDFWYPLNPDSTQAKMAFSIYIHDDSLTSQYDFPCYADNPLIDSLASLHKIEGELTFEIFPNPGSHQLSIRIPENSQGNILLHDVSGRLLHQLNASHNTLYFIDTRHLNSGIYFVTYLSEGKKSSKKWIKQ